jgi:hypothetical protein
MISSQKSAVLFFVFALVVTFMLAPVSAGVIYRAKRNWNNGNNGNHGNGNNGNHGNHGVTPVALLNGIWKGQCFGEATFYEIGLGACGKYNTNSELVFAMPCGMFDQATINGNPNLNPNCGLTAIVSRMVKGVKKSVTVTCVDRCAGCKPGDIDLSPAAFNLLATPSEGRVNVEVEFLGVPAIPLTPTP